MALFRVLFGGALDRSLMFQKSQLPRGGRPNPVFSPSVFQGLGRAPRYSRLVHNGVLLFIKW